MCAFFANFTFVMRHTLLSFAILATFCTIPRLAWAGDPPGVAAARPVPVVVVDPLMPAPTRDTDSTLVWKAGERLTWADFRGQAGPADPLHALTSSDLDVQVSCADDDLHVAVQAVFRPLESWSKSTDSAPLLRHEQLHFDLTEVHARLLRQTLLTTRMSCDDARKLLKPMIDAAFKTWQREEDRYDTETSHGLDQKAQAKWEEQVRGLLEKLPR